MTVIFACMRFTTLAGDSIDGLCESSSDSPCLAQINHYSDQHSLFKHVWQRFASGALSQTDALELLSSDEHHNDPFALSTRARILAHIARGNLHDFHDVGSGKPSSVETSELKQAISLWQAAAKMLVRSVDAITSTNKERTFHLNLLRYCYVREMWSWIRLQEVSNAMQTAQQLTHERFHNTGVRNTANATMEVALLLMFVRRWDSAKTLCERTLAATSDMLAHAILGLALYRLKDYNAAISHLTAALEYNDKLKAEHGRNGNDEMDENTDAALMFVVNRGPYFVAIGECMQRVGQIEEARSVVMCRCCCFGLLTINCVWLEPFSNAVHYKATSFLHGSAVNKFCLNIANSQQGQFGS